MRQYDLFRVRTSLVDLPVDESVISPSILAVQKQEVFQLGWMPEVGDSIRLLGVEFTVVRRIALTVKGGGYLHENTRIDEAVAELILKAG
jgi:hypothetical protein